MDTVGRYAAGIVHYGSDPGLADCLASLLAQSHRPAHVVVVDHDPPEVPDARRTALQIRHPEVEWVHAHNGGYAAGANRVAERALARVPEVDYLLFLNPDVVLGTEFVATLVDALAGRPQVALASGKLVRPGGRLIDSAGIARRRSRRFFDRGSEEPDDGRYADVETVFAVSGAALLLRRSAIASLRIEGELFDEDFFTYHEDTDLAWRAGELGWQSLYVPAARAVHVRGWRRGARARIPERIRRHSFKNRYLELVKNERLGALLLDLPHVLSVEVARLVYAMTVDRSLLGGYREAFALLGRARRKRAILQDRVRARRGSMAAGRVVAAGFAGGSQAAGYVPAPGVEGSGPRG